MLDKIVSLSKEFISIKSNSDSKDELDKILKIALSNLKDYTIERFENKGVKSALIYNAQKRPSKFKIILNGHLDVVPGKDYLYSPEIKGDKLYGVGSMDMKASVACLIMVFREMVDKVGYPLALQLVTDEEIGGFNGTKFQIDNGIKADFVIAGESTGLQIANRAKGVLQVKISTIGKTAHGAYPWRGENAILKMNQFLDSLYKRYPIPDKQEWVTTVNLSNIKTNNEFFNKIPDYCEVSLDIRYVPEDKIKIMDQIKHLVPRGFRLEIVFRQPPLFVKENNKYIKMLQSSAEKILRRKVLLYCAHGTSDTTYYARVGCPAVEFGPIGIIGNTYDEHVNIPSLEMYYKVLTKFLLSLNNPLQKSTLII